MLRAYDSSELFREDTLLRVQHISDEIEAIQKSLDKVEKEVTAFEKRIRWLKKIEAWRLGRRW